MPSKGDCPPKILHREIWKAKITIGKILVTGGAGLIGSHGVDALLAAGYEVTVLDNLSTGHMENLAHRRDQITFVEGSGTDADAVTQAIQGCECVLHLAAQISLLGRT